jgi:16S rRNA (cytosine1402-N4)-methyltransferase
VAEAAHLPVMVTEVVEILRDRGRVLDMTLGAGGHTEALFAAGVRAVVGVDRDPLALRIASERLAGFGDRFSSLQRDFSEVDEADTLGPVDGVLFDLGVSSMQLDEAARGFGFRQDAPLDMRMGTEGPTAADLVNDLPEKELADLIFGFGQEPKSRRIASAIVRNRQKARIETTDQLAGVVVGAVGKRPGGPHPARRTFQALRIAVNRELEELAAALPQAVDLLAPGGRVVVISYHSLEDGFVKRTFRADARLAILTKKPLVPSADEIARNPRARSAKFRAAERIPAAA